MLWILIAALCLLTVFILWRAMQSHSTLKMESVQQRNIAIAQERSLEIDSALETGDLDASEHKQAMQDLQISLADEIATSIELKDQFRSSSSIFNYTALAIVPMLAVGVYSLTSNYQANTVSADMQADVPNKALSVETLVKRVEDQVNANPQEQEGLFVLAQTYSRMGRFKESAERFGQLITLSQPSADLYTHYADNIAMANERVFTQKTADILSKALALEPNHVSALWLSGIAEQQLGNNEAALRHWLQLKPLLKNDPESSQELASLIDEVSLILGTRAAKIKAQIPTNLPIAAQTKTSSPAKLTVKVSLSSELQAEVDPNDTVFIFAKAESGPPMPLAAKKLSVSSLPITIVLDDSMSVSPQVKLSSFDKVLVGARLSKTGKISQQADGLTSKLIATTNNNPETIEIIISKTRP